MGGENRIFTAQQTLKAGFAGIDEQWVIAHRGNHASNLRRHGITDRIPLTVMHAHSSMGVQAVRSYPVPKDSGGSYESLLTQINPGIEGEVRRVVNDGKKVALMMPFPNAGLDEVMANVPGSERHFVNTGTVERFEHFSEIEDKVRFAAMLDEVLEREGMAQNKIPSTTYRPGQRYEDLCAMLGGEVLYFQRALSAGGDGTVKVESAEEMSQLFEDADWRNSTSLKVSKGIFPNYPSNGTGCIVPTPDGNDCVVYLDPLSHKPVGLPELGAKPGSGVGNDWTVPFDERYQRQYARMAEAVGREMYRRYGYTGLFGPDGLIDMSSGTYHMTEVNPRWQGTTPFQTGNAFINGRVPLEYIHYLTKLAGHDPKKLDEIFGLTGDPNTYNAKSLTEEGGYYIKVGSPKVKKVVRKDMNGAFAYAQGDGFSALPGISQDDVYTGKHGYAGRGKVVYISAPKPGEMVGGELSPIGYIVGSGQQVFDAHEPKILPEAYAMYNAAFEKMFESPVITGRVF